MENILLAILLLQCSVLPCRYSAPVSASSCPLLDFPKHGWVNMPGREINTIARFGCYSGFGYNGSITRTCQPDGTWSGTDGKCEVSSCPLLDFPKHGWINMPGREINKIATFGCNSGFAYSGSTLRICQTDGTWSGTDGKCKASMCPLLDFPKHGWVNMPGREINTIATFGCYSGFWYTGCTSRTCQPDGTWSGTEGTCEASSCPLLDFPEHGWLNMLEHEQIKIAMFGCNDGYWYNGTTSRTCQSDRTWSGTNGTCEAVLCPELHDPANGQVLQNNRTFHAFATVACAEGYIHNRKENTLQCQGNNRWKGQVGECKAVLCPELPDPQHGRIEQNNRSYLATALVLCEEGYVYNQPDHLILYCQGNNTWSHQHIGACQEAPCPDIDEVENGIMSSTTGHYKDTVTLQCLSGYTMDGPFQITCKADGTWSVTLGKCAGRPRNPLLFLLFLLLVPLVMVIIFVIWKCFLSRSDDPTGKHVLIPTKTIHCSFALKGGFGEGWPERLNNSIIEEQVKKVIDLSLGITPDDATVELLCKSSGTVFIDLITQKKLVEKDVIDAVQKISFSVIKEQDIHVEKGSVLIRDEWLDKVAKQVMADSHVPDRELDERIDLDTQYVRLRLLPKQEFETLEKQDLEYRPDRYQADLQLYHGEDMREEDLLKGGETKKLILLRGRAGFGKSTLVQHLLRNWACGRWATHIKVIFLLNLRYLMQIARTMTLSKLLTLYSVYPAQNISLPDDDWFKRHQKHLGIILDGIDEVWDFKGEWAKVTASEDGSNHEHKPLTWCMQLLSRKYLPESTIIVSSRPIADLSLIKATMRIELMGLTRDSVIEFVEKNVKPCKRINQVKCALQNNPILMSVSAITFYCAALCTVLGRDNATIEDLRTYTQITAYIMERFMARCLTKQHKGELSSSFEAIAKLAYHSLFRTQASDVVRLTFDQEIFDELGINKNQVDRMCEAGLFLQTSIADPEGHGESRTLGQFVHPSVQEFLAVIGLLLYQTLEQVQNSMSQMLASGQFGMAQMFAYGVAFNANDKNIQEMINMVSPEKEDTGRTQTVLKEALLSAEGVTNLQALQIINESQSEEMAREYVKEKMDDKIEFINTPLTAVDINALLFTLRHHQTLHTLRLIRVNLESLSVKGVAELVNFSQSIDDLSLNDKTIDDECLQELENTLEDNTSLHTFYIGHGPIGENGYRSMTNILQKLKKLQYFGSTSYGLNDDQVGQHLHNLYQYKLLKYMSFNSRCMTDEGVKKIADHIKSNVQIETLGLTLEGMTDAGIEKIATAPKVKDTLEQVRLRSNLITDSGVKKLTDALAESHSLLEFLLGSCRITTKGVRHVAELVGNNQTLKDVELYLESLTETGAHHVIKALEQNERVEFSLHLVKSCNDHLRATLDQHPRVKITAWGGGWK